MKTHLVVSASPLTFSGQPMNCLCGIVLAHPEPVLMVDLSQREMPEFDHNSLRDCSVCIRRAEKHPALLDEYGAPGMAGRRLYLYALVEGEALRQYEGNCIEGLVGMVEKLG